MNGQPPPPPSLAPPPEPPIKDGQPLRTIGQPLPDHQSTMVNVGSGQRSDGSDSSGSPHWHHLSVAHGCGYIPPMSKQGLNTEPPNNGNGNICLASLPLC
ncbi:hypothetical protein Tco_0983105 [Tanacetum coccineum]